MSSKSKHKVRRGGGGGGGGLGGGGGRGGGLGGGGLGGVGLGGGLGGVGFGGGRGGLGGGRGGRGGGGWGRGGGWGPGWKPGKWGPGWGAGWSGTWAPGWACPYGNNCGWNRWAYWDPVYYANYLSDYPLQVTANCMPQCQLDCMTDNPGQDELCKDSCNSYCNRLYPNPPPCKNICMENCYVPGTSMIKTCNDYCLGNPECTKICEQPGRPLDAPGFNSCNRVCNEACLKK